VRTKRTTTQTKKNEKSKFFHVVRLHFIRAPKAVVEGERGVNKREKEREGERQTERDFYYCERWFSTGLSFFLSERQQEEEERQKKRIRENF